MSIDAIKGINLFENTKRTQMYQPAAIPSGQQQQFTGQKAGLNPFAQGISEVAQIGMQKAQMANIGLGGTNSPTETLGNKLMLSA